MGNCLIFGRNIHTKLELNEHSPILPISPEFNIQDVNEIEIEKCRQELIKTYQTYQSFLKHCD